MKHGYSEVRVGGDIVKVPSIQVNGMTVVVTGRWIRVATVRNDQLVEGAVVSDPAAVISKLKLSGLKPDVFTFPQKVYEGSPKYRFPFELESAAVVRTDNFTVWWNKLPQEARKNTRRAAKRGVLVREVNFDSELVKGIKSIYDETPIRQGKRFYHYGKSLEAIQKEQGEYVDRSQFIGAYYQDELIGFIKLVLVDTVAQIMQILPKISHYDKRPMNALISKAVEICGTRGISYLVYGSFSYGNKRTSDLTIFKTRNGFEPFNFPRYYVPLTVKGALIVKAGFHRGLLEILPLSIINFLLRVRTGFIRVCSRERPIELVSLKSNDAND